MDTLTYDISHEIQKLRQLKMIVFNCEYKGSEISAPEICLSVDVLLVPLYWFVKKNNRDEISELCIEDYLQDAVISFEKKVQEIIPSIIERTAVLDKKYNSHPFKTYRSIIYRCFPQYVTSSNN